MSLLQPMFNEVNSFSPGHMRSRSHNELLKSLNTIQSTFSSKKRSFNDLSEDLKLVHSNKRSRTAPPSPPSPPGTVPPFLHPYSPSVTGDDSPPSVKKYSKSLRSRSLSPGKKLYNPLSPVSSPPTVEQQRLKDVYKERIEPRKIKLPLISSALNAAPLTTSEPIKLKPIAPTVSLDYFDTYKPNDENWRYELLDSINRGSKHFNLNQYNYLNKHLSPTSSPSSSSAYSQPSSFYKPNFDSRISSRITKPTLIPSINHSYERKINFPYESNYTYLNKTYLNDVEKYPEYLELAQSLIQLSKPKQTSPHSPLAGETHPQPEYDSQHQYQHQQPHQIQQQAQVQSQPQTQPQHEQYQHQLQPIPQRQTALAPPPIVYAASMVPPPITTSAPANYYTSPQAYSYHNVYETPSQQQYQQSPQNMEQHVHSQVAAVAVQSLPVPGQVPSLVHHVPSAIYAAPIFQGAQTLQAPASAMMIPPIAHQSPNESIHEIQDKPSSPVQVESLASTVQATQNHRFIPITPPSKAKSSVKSPPKNSGHSHNHNHNPRICISCGSDQSPCWRPSWSIKEGQLCNSCGLRYKKTSARCLNTSCKKIPAKGDWSLMQSKGKLTFEDGVEGYSCLECGWRVEVKK